MGISLSTALERESKSHSTSHNTICVLRSLERKFLRKLDEQASKLYVAALHDKCLPIVCAVDKTQKILLKVNSVSQNEVKKRINQVLHGNYLEELVKLLTGKINNVLETTVVGDEERSFTHVVFANKSILRVDFFVYYRSFTPAEGLSEYNNILAYFIQVGLLEVTKVRPQVLIYELTRATEEDKVDDACKKREARASSTEQLNYAVQYTGKVPWEEADGNCELEEEDGSKERSPRRLLENFTWSSFGKLMALVITFTLCSALSGQECKLKHCWWSLSNIFLGNRELRNRCIPGLYILYFIRR